MTITQILSNNQNALAIDVLNKFGLRFHAFTNHLKSSFFHKEKKMEESKRNCKPDKKQNGQRAIKCVRANPHLGRIAENRKAANEKKHLRTIYNRVF